MECADCSYTTKISQKSIQSYKVKFMTLRKDVYYLEPYLNNNNNEYGDDKSTILSECINDQ